MRTLLIVALFLLSSAVFGLNLYAAHLEAAIPLPKCGSSTCECGCNSGGDCRCAFRK